MTNENMQCKELKGTTVDVSPRQTGKRNIDYAKVVVKDKASGKVLSSKRVALLAG
ncbi:hypothetical protein JYT31_01445 [Beggiatoa alba]|nr:hypothetical protein [Beggiatoa alba]